MEIKNIVSKKRLASESRKYEFYKGSNSKYVISDFDNVKTDRMFMTDCIDKSSIDEFYKGLIKLVTRYSKDSEEVIEVLKDNIYNYERSLKSLKFEKLCVLEPDTEELRGVVSSITISMYNMSKDSVGVIFDILYHESLINLIDSFIRNEHRFDYPEYIGEAMILSDITIEVKSRVNDLVKSYLPLLLPKLSLDPVSLNIYNIKLKDYKDLNENNIFVDLEYETVKFDKTRLSNSLEHDAYLKFSGLDVHNNSMEIVIDSELNSNEIESVDLLNIFTVLTCKYILDGMVNVMRDKKNRLVNVIGKNNKMKENYDILFSLEEKMLVYRTTLEDLIKYPGITSEVDVLFKLTNVNFKDRLIDYKEVIDSYSSNMTITNYKSAYYLALLSLIGFTISSIIDIFVAFFMT